jgi:pilus assembly protein Flp/PilA
MRLNFSNFLRDEEGATAIEYGLIAALIAVVAMVAMGNVGDSLKGIFQKIAEELGYVAPTT